jgi:hypothetical protein
MINQNTIISFIVFIAIVLGAYLWFNKDKVKEPTIPAVVNTNSVETSDTEVVVTQTSTDPSVEEPSAQPINTQPGFPETGSASIEAGMR